MIFLGEEEKWGQAEENRGSVCVRQLGGYSHLCGAEGYSNEITRNAL